jgi:PadR family transcriptional regulator PadR
MWGLLISTKTGRPTGTIYPLLERLEGAGFLQSRRETGVDRPGQRRRLYLMLPAGRDWADGQLDRATAQGHTESS